MSLMHISRNESIPAWDTGRLRPSLCGRIIDNQLGFIMVFAVLQTKVNTEKDFCKTCYKIYWIQKYNM